MASQIPAAKQAVFSFLGLNKPLLLQNWSKLDQPTQLSVSPSADGDLINWLGHARTLRVPCRSEKNSQGPLWKSPTATPTEGTMQGLFLWQLGLRWGGEISSLLGKKPTPPPPFHPSWPGRDCGEASLKWKNFDRVNVAHLKPSPAETQFQTLLC